MGKCQKGLQARVQTSLSAEPPTESWWEFTFILRPFLKYKNKWFFVAWHTECGFYKKYFRWQKATLRDWTWKSHSFKQQTKLKPNRTHTHQRIRSSQHHGKVYIFVQHNLLYLSKSLSIYHRGLGETIPKLHYMAVIFRFISLHVM